MSRGVRSWRAISVRMSAELIAAIDEAAARSGRSREAEVWFRVTSSMDGESFDAHGCIVKQSTGMSKALGEQPGGAQ